MFLRSNRDHPAGSCFIWAVWLGYNSDMKQPLVSRSLDVMGGTAVFHGTRVPVQTLLDYLEAGESIDDFLQGYPSVTREHVIAFLEEAKDRVIEAAP